MNKKTDFSLLYRHLLAEAKSSGNVRLKNTLDNNESRKEYICRKLGVVTPADVVRISANLKTKKKI